MIKIRQVLITYLLLIRAIVLRTTKYRTKWIIYEKYAFHRKQLFYITDTFSDAKAVFYNALRCDVNVLNYKLLEKEERIL